MISIKRQSAEKIRPGEGPITHNHSAILSEGGTFVRMSWWESAKLKTKVKFLLVPSFMNIIN